LIGNSTGMSDSSMHRSQPSVKFRPVVSPIHIGQAQSASGPSGDLETAADRSAETTAPRCNTTADDDYMTTLHGCDTALSTGRSSSIQLISLLPRRQRTTSTRALASLETA